MEKFAYISSLQLARAVLLLFLFVRAGATWAQNETNQPPLHPPGSLVDVGGWRLHINCTGKARASQPTVVLEAGIGDFSVEWSLVQPGVAKFARVCSYDCAGDGWSELGPHPRTMHQIVFELHILLEKAGVRPPYVLVGHSYGGPLVRLYAATYPADVAGMVLITVSMASALRVFGIGSGQWSRRFALMSGVLSMAFGCLVAFQILLLNGLLTGHPNWTPK